MKNFRFRLFLLVLCVFFVTSNASASIITFDDIPDDFRGQNLPSYSEAGFILSVNCQGCVNVFSTSEAIAYSGYGTQPAAAAGWGASNRFLETWNTFSVFTLKLANGKAFDFNSMNIGWFNNSITNASWNVRVFDQNGVQIGSSQDYTGIGFFSFNYSNVYAVELQSNGGFSSFDNLSVAAVPAPATLGLFGLSLVLTLIAGRKKLLV